LKSDKQILYDFLEKLRKKLAERIPDATGKTSSSLEVIISASHGSLLGAYYIGALEYGRSPRKNIEDQGMWKNIQKWLMARGLPSSDSNAKSLTWYINKYGTLQYRLGKPSGIISGVINESVIERLRNELGDKYLIEVHSDILEQFKRMR
jgi:hypothetical protein